MVDFVFAYRNSTPFRCVTETYYIVTSKHPITNSVLDSLRAQGKLGYGQQMTLIQEEWDKLDPAIYDKLIHYKYFGHVAFVRDFCDSSD